MLLFLYARGEKTPSIGAIVFEWGNCIRFHGKGKRYMQGTHVAFVQHPHVATQGFHAYDRGFLGQEKEGASQQFMPGLGEGET